ncbi:uncharacterized protein LOC139932165 [Centroberyx gerrardi]
MKRGTLNFLGRKNQSLFDTNIKIKDMDNVELVLDSSAIPESGTAKVRSRPTVKHHISSSDSLVGFAVPTPKVPVLPPFNGLKTNGSVSGDWLSNGSVISVPDLVEGEILVPPPPSMAPPPPPPQHIPPPPDFMGDLDSAVLANLHPPSMLPPKPPSLAPSLEEEDLTSLKPPPMAPPKPPSTCSSGSTSSLSISTPSPANIPDRPKFAPPQPPIERQHKTQKTPPAKPMRLSSIPSMDCLPQAPVPAPSVQTPRPSTFNPQNTAKLYNVPKTSILSGHVDRETRPKQILLLEDSGSANSVPVPIQMNGKAPPVAPPSKPVRRNSSGDQLEKDPQELKQNLQTTLPSQSPLSQPKREAKTETVSTQQEKSKPFQTPYEISPKLQKGPIAQINSEGNQGKLEECPSQSRKFSPLLDRKLRNLKTSETSGAREGPAASPLALLMAAKEREKQRSSLSRENSTKKNEQSSTSIQPSDSNPHSFVVIPRTTSSSSLTSQGRLQESPKSVIPVEHTLTIQTPGRPRSPALVKGEMASTNPTLSAMSTAASPAASNLAVQREGVERGPPRSESAQDEELSMPLLPPPPEFANDDLDEIMEPPPTTLPPDPPMKKTPSPNVSPVPPVQGPSPPPKPKPPAPPKLPPPDTDVKPKPPFQTKSKVPPTQPPSSLSASQATLLSILQKKMLEMDHKIVPMKETDSSSDDWGSPLSDEETKVPFVPRAAPQNNNYSVPSKPASLDMRELESKVAKKYQDKPSSKGATSNGPQSKHQYGMTFTVRPGTKQPITLVSKGDSS